MSHDPRQSAPRTVLGTVAGGTSAAGPLPLLRRDEAPPAAIQALLTEAARRAVAGDLASRDALFLALTGPIERQVWRYRRRLATAGGIWDIDDVRQEAYLAFVATLAEWPPDLAFFPFFLVRFPSRLADGVRRLGNRGRIVSAAVDLLHDGSAEAEAGLVQLEAIALSLAEPSRQILLWRVRDGHSFELIARRLGLSRRTVYRRWRDLLTELRAALSVDPGSA